MFWRKEKPPQILLEQLESLINHRVPFVFLNLTGEKNQPSLLQQSESCRLQEVQQTLEQKATDKSSPIVLVCKNGKASGKKASELIKQGYLNVYALEGGVQSLSSK